jgi:hypothetical protein
MKPKPPLLAALLFALLPTPPVVQAAPYTYTDIYGTWTYNSNNFMATIGAYSGPGGGLVIPDIVSNGVPVTGFSDFVFNGNQTLTSVTIPDTVTSIGGSGVFNNCTNLTNVNIGNGVVSIGSSAFANCRRLPGIVIPDNVRTIGGFAFNLCTTLTNLSIGTGVTNIGSQAFQQCLALTSASIPANVSSIGSLAFYECTALTTATIGNNSTNIGQSIGQSAFSDCPSLTNLTIGSSVSSIGPSAFVDCYSLTTVTIPGSVTNFGNEAFDNCTNLKSVYFLGNAPHEDGTGFYNTTATIYYMPGTAGWGITFGSRPTMLWNPHARSAGVTAGQFGFQIVGPTNATILVVASTNLSAPSWTPLSTNTLTGGVSTFTDTQSSNYPLHFYRFRSP